MYGKSLCLSTYHYKTCFPQSNKDQHGCDGRAVNHWVHHSQVTQPVFTLCLLGCVSSPTPSGRGSTFISTLASSSGHMSKFFHHYTVPVWSQTTRFLACAFIPHLQREGVFLTMGTHGIPLQCGFRRINVNEAFKERSLARACKIWELEVSLKSNKR